MAFTLLTGVTFEQCTPGFAAGVDDLARKNCVAEIIRSTDVDRNTVKSFQFSKQGSGYVMRGLNEDHRTVICQTAADGHVLMITVS